jgi:hypothetical protein
MPRIANFLVTMQMRDDDQTDSVEMAGFIADVLNCKNDNTMSWQEATEQMRPDYRPLFTVELIIPTEKGDIA